MKETIKKIVAKEILDSRGNPTVSVTISSENFEASTDTPSGASTGKYEAVELRDGDKSRFNGKGVLKAVENINKTIASALIGKDPLNQEEIDRIMLSLDGTPNKSNLGGNATIAVSIAVLKLAAKISNKPLYEYIKETAKIKPSRKFPYLQMNLVNGGQHASSSLAFQEYHTIADTENLNEAIENIYRVQNELKKTLKANTGDEGGFVPQMSEIEEPLVAFNKAVETVGLTGKVKYSLDVASSSFFEDGLYDIGNKKITAEELLSIYKDLCNKYPIISIEDPFNEDDFEMFAKLKKEIPSIIVIGDDLTVTNKSKLQDAIKLNSVGGLIIKPNQIGTMTEVFETMKLARDNNINCVVSHRSGETNDDFIADLAIGTGAYAVKFGALQRGERIAKYNRLSSIINY
ncbi:MAG: enolase [bacterium]